MATVLRLGILMWVSCLIASGSGATTETRIIKSGYPVEVHKVITSDGYILQLFRIPYSNNKNSSSINGTERRPAALVQHGLLSSSDCWIINGPENALAYLLADAGYDVWLGNFRGNTYSRKHVRYSPSFQPFWRFEWHHMGIHDLPAMIDYILYKTGQKSLHYLGHSQGTTALFVMLSLLPKYNDLIKSAHLMAPVAYMSHMQSPMARLLAPVGGRPNAFVDVLGSAEFLPNNKLLGLLGAELCKAQASVEMVCENTLFLLCGFSTDNFNTTLLPDIMKTHPAGCSVNQIGHYLQEEQSAKFRQFDYGFRNKMEYKQKTPPNYQLSEVRAELYLYYSDNDWLAHVIDVHQLLDELKTVKEAFRVPDKRWNHLDFLWALEVKETIYDRAIGHMNKIEAEGKF